MNLQPNNVHNIPLHCNVCPKKPRFSDVSHLLTHVASKGHLSAYYKMKVQASTDDSAKQIIDAYDEWYEDFNLEVLMRERMSQKEKRRGTGHTSRRSSAATTINSGRSTAGSTAPGGERLNRLRDNMQLLDPQLAYRLHSEPLSRSVTPQSVYTLDPAGFQLALAHGIQNRAPSGVSYSNSPLIKEESFDSDASDDDDDFDLYEDAPATNAPRRGQGTSVSAGSIDEISIDDLANDATKLKGIFWPGMDMFDSATPEARRKRNQKKNISVLKSLQATSEVVQPTECVYDSEGVLQKEREITGNPESEDDLIEGEGEPAPVALGKKRTSRRSRPALAEKDINTGRVLRNSRQVYHPPLGRKAKQPHFKVEDDDDLTYELPHKKRSGLSIHRDNSGPDITFDQPAPLNYLTAGFQSPFQPTAMQPQITYNNTAVPRAHSQQQSWGQFNGGFRPNSTTSNQVQHFPNFSQFLTSTVGQMNPSPFQQQMGNASHLLQNSQAMFPTLPCTAWDFLGLEHDDLGMLANSGNPFHLNGDVPTADPLYFGAPKEDDEATVSVAEDDR